MSDTDTNPLPGTTRDPNLPDSDGRVMGETDYHIAAIILLREALQDFFADRDDVYVASNMLLYYEIGGVRNRRDPDVLVAIGVHRHYRRSFRTWEEKTVPRVVFEVSSENTWESDYYDKRNEYARLGIPEYFLFDPENRFLNPAVQGFRLRKGGYAPVRPTRAGALVSRELGLRLIAEEHMLRLVDDATGNPVPTRQERNDALAAEVERLRGLLEGERGPNGNRK